MCKSTSVPLILNIPNLAHSRLNTCTKVRENWKKKEHHEEISLGKIYAGIIVVQNR